LNGLDLFSGIGGLSLALAPWVRPIAYCENDRYAQSVLLARMADGLLVNAPIWDDICTLTAREVPPVDFLYGGFPCQDISVAGHGKGLSGSRSGLYWEMHRLIKEIKPTFVFLENVPAIRTRGAIEVARSLDELGYYQNWDVISAREVGAPFIGERWFLLAAADSETLREQQGWWEREGWEAPTFNPSISNLGLTPWTPKGGFEPRVFGAGNGIPFAVDRDRALGNAVVPLQAQIAFKRLAGIK